MKPCAWCPKDFQPRKHKQRCCSWSCAQQLRAYEARQQPGYKPPRPSTWRKKERSPAHGYQHQKLRAQLLPLAIGKPCPFCHQAMVHGQALALDHIRPVSMGGKTERSNVRITHAICNHRAGAILGNRSPRRYR